MLARQLFPRVGQLDLGLVQQRYAHSHVVVVNIAIMRRVQCCHITLRAVFFFYVDHDPHQIFLDINQPGQYAIQLSGRSTKFKVDRILVSLGNVPSNAATGPSSSSSCSTAACAVPCTRLHYCSGGSCRNKLEEGNSCSSGSQCLSGHCVGAACCASSISSLCGGGSGGDGDGAVVVAGPREVRPTVGVDDTPMPPGLRCFS